MFIGTGRNWALQWLIDMWVVALATPVSAKSWTLEGTDWALSASSIKTLATAVLAVSVTLQVPVWHCLHRGLQSLSLIHI